MQGLSRNLQGQGQGLTLSAGREGMAGVAGGMIRAKVWDLPVRAIHWSMAALIPFSWWSAKYDHFDWHRLSGYTLLGLLVFRLIWGVVGSPTARFAQFLRGPKGVIAYARGVAKAAVGHNPLGGWSVVALLAVMAAQVTLGLFSIDENSIEAGPLADRISFDTARALAHLHHQLFWVLLGLIGLHLGAILIYALRGKRLVPPMINGVAQVDPGMKAPPLAPFWRAIPVAFLGAATAWFVAHGLKI